MIIHDPRRATTAPCLRPSFEGPRCARAPHDDGRILVVNERRRQSERFRFGRGKGRRALPRARAQVSPRDLRRPHRPGADGAHARATRSRPAACRRPGSSPACAASARPPPPASSPARSTTRSRAAPMRPTIHMPALGIHCQAIMESRHVDVIEIDGASNNGVDDVRQLNDAVRYAPARRATRSTSSTKCTCSRRRRSTRC